MAMKLYVKDESEGTYRSARPLEILAAMADATEKLFKRGEQFIEVNTSSRFLSLKLVGKESEVFACLFLDNKHRLIQYEELFFGTIDSAAVHPREVVKRALHHNAAAVIAAHNHPSGNSHPSRADENITIRLRDALALVDVRLLDHIVVGHDSQTSLAEMGVL